MVYLCCKSCRHPRRREHPTNAASSREHFVACKKTKRLHRFALHNNLCSLLDGKWPIIFNSITRHNFTSHLAILEYLQSGLLRARVCTLRGLLPLVSRSRRAHLASHLGEAFCLIQGMTTSRSISVKDILRPASAAMTLISPPPPLCSRHGQSPRCSPCPR